jgi:hypothetical protein
MKMGDLIIKDTCLSVEVGEVSKAAITRDQCTSSIPDIYTRVRSTRIGIEVQIFTSLPTVSTRVVYKALECFNTFFSAKRQCRIYHFCLLFM